MSRALRIVPEAASRPSARRPSASAPAQASARASASSPASALSPTSALPAAPASSSEPAFAPSPAPASAPSPSPRPARAAEGFHRRWSDKVNAHFLALGARLAPGVSPVALRLAMTDWMLALSSAPGTQLELAAEAAHQWIRLLGVASTGRPATDPRGGDHRFDDAGWKTRPFDLAQQAFLLAEEWVDATVQRTPAMAPHARALVAFTLRQSLDMLSPSNFWWSNPEVLRRAAETGGANFVQGFHRWRDDLAATVKGGGQPRFEVGRDVAATPGKVVFRNELFELLQFSPTTDRVRAEPVLIVPAWIMKYYILDLAEQNSLVRWLTAQGFTVFCISWRNPGAEMADTGFDDYRTKGLMAAIDAACAIAEAPQLHACGYCLGGTLLAIGAAAMARDGDKRLRSMTMLAAQTDFSEPGQLSLFIDEDQLAALDAMMLDRGYLDGRQMGAAFQMLDSRNLIWSHMVRSYLLGEPARMNELMAWNADTTRMPARMHSEYLHAMFLENRLATGRYRVDGHPIAVGDIRVPMFAVGTETDHVAPWRSVHKLHLLSDGDITFVLTAGGHNAGIVSEPGHPHRHYRAGRRPAGGAYVDADGWFAQAELKDGSWWPEWAAWLARQSSGEARAREPGNAAAGYPALDPAPGRYVLER